MARRAQLMLHLALLEFVAGEHGDTLGRAVLKQLANYGASEGACAAGDEDGGPSSADACPLKSRGRLSGSSLALNTYPVRTFVGPVLLAGDPIPLDLAPVGRSY